MSEEALAEQLEEIIRRLRAIEEALAKLQEAIGPQGEHRLGH